MFFSTQHFDRKSIDLCYFLFFLDGLNMTSNSNGSGNNGEINSGNLRLDCSSAAGAPTLTTPTLTPTTLRNIEQMFLEASNGNNLVEQPIVHENAAHFVPPPISMELPNINNTSGSHAVPLPGPSSNSVKVPPPLPGIDNV